MAINIASTKNIIDHTLVFVGDMLPYSVIFLLTLMVSYRFGLESAGAWSLAYAYVAIVTAMVCGPNLLSIRRRIVNAVSAGAVVLAALGIRGVAIALGALSVAGLLIATGTRSDAVLLMSLLFIGRFLETSVDGPATGLQYLRSPKEYFFLRLTVSVVVCGIAAVAVFTADAPNLARIALFYVLGSFLGFLIAVIFSRRLLYPVAGLSPECQGQISEFGKFFVATALFVLASRIHPIIIDIFAGKEAAGQFALVQNLFASLALAASGVAGVFFWSRNRLSGQVHSHGVPWRWLVGGTCGGLLLGGAGGLLLDLYFLRPLGSGVELRIAGWILCLSTPLFLTQSIMSNLLVLLNRDRAMLQLSALNAIVGLILITLLVYVFGLVGAAASVAISAFVATVLGIFIVKCVNE